MTAIEQTKQTRRNFIDLLNGLTHEQCCAIPKGFRNSIAWNFGHAVVTQQLLCYKLAGLEMKLTDETVNMFKKGTIAAPTYDRELMTELKGVAIHLLEEFESDLEANIYKGYQDYTTSYNVTLTSIEEATSFNAIHEGLHFGYAMAIRRTVTAG